MNPDDLPLAAVLGAEIDYFAGPQGSPEWVSMRAGRFGASEAAAMLGLSPYETRAAMLARKDTGIEPEHDEHTLRVFARGHAVEAAIRGHVETIVGDDLSPVTCTRRGTRLIASCDGLTLMRDVAWECKQWNEALAEQVRAGVIPDTHMPQCQQVLLVTGAERLVFTVTDGTPEGTVWCEVRPDMGWFDRIVRGWAQFAADLAGWAPPAAAAPVVAEPVEALPAVALRIDGAIAVQGNLDRFEQGLRSFIARIPKQPTTDQEFADAAQAVKLLDEAERALAAAENAALAQLREVEEMRTRVRTLGDLMRGTRLATGKQVEARKAQIREEAVQRGARALMEHRRAHELRLRVALPPQQRGNFAGVIKGLRSLDSLHNAIDTELAAAKIEADQIAERVERNLGVIDAAAAPHLFADRVALAAKDAEAVQVIVAQRVREEQDRKQRVADAARAAAEQQAQVAEAARSGSGNSSGAPPLGTPAPAAPSVAPAAQVAAGAPPVKLADICDRLGWRLTAAEVGVMGVPTFKQHVTVMLAAVDVPKLKAALLARVQAL